MTALHAALAEHRPGHALPRVFALDPEIHARELDAIWRASWLFAGVSAQARHPGDFFCMELAAGDSVILVRGEDLDAGEYGLRCAAVAEIGGLVFVWLGTSGAEPGPLADAAGELGAALSAQGIDRARIAHHIDYDVRANWKLVWENNRECWHCHAGHPEYVTANFDAVPDTERHRRAAAERSAQHAAALAELAAPADAHDRPGLYPFPAPGRWWSANRTPLREGFVTESLDGRPVAPLMGDYAGHDVGTLRVRTVPNFWCHASADHAVVTRLLPAGPERTAIRVMWLVDEAAEPGRDYELERLLPFWQLTSKQDWALCERNHAGVRNPAFTPGPYSPRRESNVRALVDWYLARLATG